MKVVVTGANGFLGWHTRARLHTLTDHDVVAIGRDNWGQLGDAMADADAIIHLAGINRGSDQQVELGNIELARSVTEALQFARPDCRIVFANSIQSGSDTPYGRGKAAAAALLAEAAPQRVSDVRLPNIFGEHARANYNTFVATFIEGLLRGQTPTIQDREVNLLHAQDAAAALIANLTPGGTLEPLGTDTTVQWVYDQLFRFHTVYGRGEIPHLPSKFDVDLFNTYRSAVFPARYPFSLMINSDERGELIETVRAHGVGGQTFVSYTKPGMTRGEHFHLSKIERFVVISGRARISLRKVLTDEIVTFDVSSQTPSVIDMPTLWVHNITNIGDSDLITLFWADQLFNPSAPDTYWEPVVPLEGVSTH